MFQLKEGPNYLFYITRLLFVTAKLYMVYLDLNSILTWSLMTPMQDIVPKTQNDLSGRTRNAFLNLENLSRNGITEKYF